MQRILNDIANVQPRQILIAICVGFICVALMTFDDYGINPDEGLHIANGKSVADWYTSGYAERGSFLYTNIWAYGGAYDVLCHFATRFSPLTVYETRHLLTAFVGLVGALGVYLLGRMVGSPWTGVLAASLLLLTPRYYGHAFFNHKDIPFAVGYVWSVLLILRCWSAFPIVPRRLILFCGLAIGFTLGLRIGGMILVFYLGAATLLWLFERWRAGELSKIAILQVVASSAVIAMIGYGVMLLAWPWAQLEPIRRPLWALSSFSKFPLVLLTMFEGKFIPSNGIPWYYAIKWLGLTLPEAVLCGSLIGIVAGFRTLLNKGTPGIPVSFVSFCVLFPVIYATTKGVPFYNGMRHILFVLPLFAVLAAYGFTTLIEYFPQYRRGLTLSLGCLGLLMVYDLVVFHPNQYVYFNRLVAGGLAHASKRYETDYYTNSYKGGLDWLEENAGHAERKIIGPPGVVFDSESFETVSDPRDADFYLGRTFTDEHLDLPGQIVHTVKANGVDLLHVIRPSGLLETMTAPSPLTAVFFHQRQAARFFAQGRRDLAIEHYRKAIEIEPNAKHAQGELSKLYFDEGDWPAAIRESEALLKIEPGNDLTRARIAVSHHNLRRFADAERNYLKALEIRDDQYFSLYQLGTLYAGSGMEERAIPILERVIKLYPMYSPPKVMLVRALVNKGDEQAATAVARRTVRAHPNLSEVHDHLINLLIGKEDWSGTMDAVHGAIAANPNRVSLWFAYARIKRITGQLDSAVVGIEQGLLLDPDHSDLQAEVIDLGKILLEKRQFEDCLRISRTSLEAKPKDPSLWSLVGASSLGLRQFKEAHDAYRAALGYDPGDEAAQIGLAKSLAEMGNGEESRGILESILSRNPGNAEAKQLMNKLAE